MNQISVQLESLRYSRRHKGKCYNEKSTMWIFNWSHLSVSLVDQHYSCTSALHFFFFKEGHHSTHLGGKPCISVLISLIAPYFLFLHSIFPIQGKITIHTDFYFWYNYICFWFRCSQTQTLVNGNLSWFTQSCVHHYPYCISVTCYMSYLTACECSLANIEYNLW